MKLTSVKFLIDLSLAFTSFSEAKTAVYRDYVPRQRCFDKCVKTVTPLIKGQTSCTRPFRSKISSLEVQACNNGEESALRNACDTTCAVIPGTGMTNEIMKLEYHEDSPIRACNKHKKFGIERFQFCRKAYNKGRDVLSEFVSSVLVEHDTVEGLITFVQLSGDELSSKNDNVGSSGIATFVDRGVEEQIHSETENVEASGLEASVQERSNVIGEESTGFKVVSDYEPSSDTNFKRMEVASHVDQEIYAKFQSEKENDESLGLYALKENRCNIVDQEAVGEFNVSKLFSIDGIVSSRGANHLNEVKGGECRRKMETTEVLEARAPLKESKNFLEESYMAGCGRRMKRIGLDGTNCARTEYHTPPPAIFEACQDGANNAIANVCVSLCRKFSESDNAKNVSMRFTSASEACSKYKEFGQQFTSCRAGYTENMRSLTVSIGSTFLEKGPVEESIHSYSDEKLSSADSDCINSSSAATFDKDMNEHFQNVLRSFKAMRFEALMEEISEFIIEDEEVPIMKSAETSVDQEQANGYNIDSPRIAIDFHLKKEKIFHGKAETVNKLETATLTSTHVSQWRLIPLQDTQQKIKANSIVSAGSTALSKQLVVNGPKSDRYYKLHPTMEQVFVDVVPYHHSCKFVGNRLCDVKKAECINISMTYQWTEDINGEGSSIDDHPAIFFKWLEVCAHMTGQCRDGGQAWHASFSPWSENHTEGIHVMIASFLHFHVENAQTGVTPLFVDTGPVDNISFTSNVDWLKTSISVNKWQHSPSVEHDERKCEQLLQQLDGPKKELSLHRSMTSKDTIYSFNSRIGTECRGMSSTISTRIGRLHNFDSLTDKSWIRDTAARLFAISLTKARIEVPCKDGSKFLFISVMWIRHVAINFRPIVPLLHLLDPDEPCNQFGNDAICRVGAICLRQYYFLSCHTDEVEDAVDLFDLENLDWIASCYYSHESMIEMNFQRQQEMICNTSNIVDLPLIQAGKGDETTHLKGGIGMLFNPSFYPTNAVVHIHSGSGDSPSICRILLQLCFCQHSNLCIWSANLECLITHPVRSTQPSQNRCAQRDSSKEVEVKLSECRILLSSGVKLAAIVLKYIGNKIMLFLQSQSQHALISLEYHFEFGQPVLMQIEQQFLDDDGPGEISFDVWDIVSLGSLNCTRLQCVSSGVLWLCLISSLSYHHARLRLHNGSIASTMNKSFMLFHRDAIDTRPSFGFVHPSLIVCFFLIMVYCHCRLRKRLISLRFEVAAYVRIFQALQDSTMLLEFRQQVACNNCSFVDMCFQDRSIQAVNELALSKIQSSGQHSNLVASYYLQLIHRGNYKRRSYRRELLLYFFKTKETSSSPATGHGWMLLFRTGVGNLSLPQFLLVKQDSFIIDLCIFFHPLFSNT